MSRRFSRMSAFTSGHKVALRFFSALLHVRPTKRRCLQQRRLLGCLSPPDLHECDRARPAMSTTKVWLMMVRVGGSTQPRIRPPPRHRRDVPHAAQLETEVQIATGVATVRAFANYDVNTSSVEQARPPGPTRASPGSRRSTRPRSRGRMPRGPAARTESYRRRAPAAASSRLVWSACLTPREAPARFVPPRRRRIPRSAVAAAARGRRATRPPAAAAVLLVSSRHRPRRTPALASSRRTSGSAGPRAAGAAWPAATLVFPSSTRSPARRTG